MRTLLLFDAHGEDALKWRIVDEDISDLHDFMLNSDEDDEKQPRVEALVFADPANEDWKEHPDLERVGTKPFPQHDAVCVVGFVP